MWTHFQKKRFLGGFQLFCYTIDTPFWTIFVLSFKARWIPYSGASLPVTPADLAFLVHVLVHVQPMVRLMISHKISQSYILYNLDYLDPWFALRPSTRFTRRRSAGDGVIGDDYIRTHPFSHRNIVHAGRQTSEEILTLE